MRRRNGFATTAWTCSSGQGRLWRRNQEEHREFAYTIGELQACLTQAGFGGIEVFGDRRTAPPGPGEQRVYFMAVREETTHG